VQKLSKKSVRFFAADIRRYSPDSLSQLRRRGGWLDRLQSPPTASQTMPKCAYDHRECIWLSDRRLGCAYSQHGRK